MAFEFDANTAKADGEFDPTTATPVKPVGAIRKMADLGLSAAKGVIAVPEAAVGLADLATQGRAGKAVEDLGVRFKDAKDVLTGFQSDDLKGKQQEFQQADGILAKAGVALSNPSLIANTVAESVPLMGAGAVPARAVMALAPKIGAMGAGAIGEGVAGAGSAGEQIRQETADGLLTGKQAALGAASGASTALFGAAGGKLAKRLGIGDVDTMLAKGSTEVAQVAGQQPKGAIRRMGEAAVSEGLLEELPQSVSEQALQNVALDRPVTQGLEDAAVMGTLSGGLMGAGAGAISRPAAQPVPPAVDVGGSAGQGLAGTEPTRVEAMGINPVGGPLQAAAAMAVDSGAHDVEIAKQAAQTAELSPTSSSGKPKDPTLEKSAGNLSTDASGSQTYDPFAGVDSFDLRTGLDKPFPDSQAPDQSSQVGGASANPTPANVNPATGEIISAFDQREADRPQALPTDILQVDGTPFTNIIQAKKAAREAGEGWAPFKLDKGVFVVRKQEVTDAPAQNQSEAAAPAATGATQSSADAVSEGGASADTQKTGALSAKTNPQPTTMGTQRNVNAGPGFSAKDVVQNVDAAAHQAATSPLNDKPEPTDGQKKAGNYTKGHTNIGGLDLAIENPAGSTRSGTDKSGKAWENTLQHHYGYIKGTIGNDKDHVDAFVKPGTPAEHTGPVYVVDQIDPDTGKFDEHKVVIGAKNGMEARRIYQTNYAKGWKGMKAITPMPFDEFKTWVKDGPKNKPLSPDVAPVSSTTEKPSEPEANQTLEATSKREEAAKPSPDEPAAGPGVGDAQQAASKPKSKPVKTPFSESPYFAAGKNDHAAGKPRVLPSYFTKPSINSRAWYAGWDAANIAAPVAAKPDTQRITTDKTELSPLVKAMNDLAEVRQRIADQGQVVDDRLMSRERQLVALVKELQADGQNDENDAEMQADKPAPAASDAVLDGWWGNGGISKDGRNLTAVGRTEALAAIGYNAPMMGAKVRWAYLPEQARQQLAAMHAQGWEPAAAPAPTAASAAPVSRNAVAARDLLAEYTKAVRDGEGQKALAAIKKRAQTLASNTPATDEAAVLALDMLATRMDTESFAFADAPAPQQAPAPAPAPKPDPLTEQEKAAKAKMLGAAAKLAALLSKNTRANITPEQEQQMLPIVIELFEGAMELGYVKFKQAARYVREFIAQAIDQDAADSIPMDTLQGAYIATARRHADKDITPKKDVISVDTIADLDEPATNQPQNEVENAGRTADTAGKDIPNDRATDNATRQGALDQVAPGENGAAPGDGTLFGGNAGSGQAGSGPNGAAAGGRVPGARGGRGGAGRARTPATGGRRRDGAVGTRGTGPDGSQLSAFDEGLDPEQASAPNIGAQNYRITEADRLGQGGEVQKFNDNIAAIRVLKTLDAEQRRATPGEQRALARYVGWGGLPSAFPNPKTGAFKDGWDARGKELRELLDDRSYDAAKRSTLDAHYTSETVVRAMWSAVARLGFKGGLALESSMGSGNFLGMIPQEFAGSTRFVGVEYDATTARVAEALYPQETVLHAGFHKVPVPDNTFALNIGNPPFGAQSLTFQFKPELAGVSIHNQFFRAAMDALRPGGVQALVVSRFLLDAQDKGTRLALAKQARLLGAIRLPDTAFKENARTEVVTDIIFLQKLTEAEQNEMAEAVTAYQARPEKNAADERERRKAADKVPAWVETGAVADPLGGEKITLNQYFKDNPRQILGVLERSGSMQHGADVTVRLDDKNALAGMLADAIARLPEDVMNVPDEVLANTQARFKSLSDSLRIQLNKEEPGHLKIDLDGKLQRVLERETPEGDYEFMRQEINADSPWSEQLYLDAQGRWYRLDVALDEKGEKKKIVKNGKVTKLNEYERVVFQNEADIPATLRLGKDRLGRLTQLVRLRDYIKRQLTLEAEDKPEAVLEASRKSLRSAYEAFVKAHGPVNRPANAALVGNMPDGGLVLASELNYKPAVSKEQAAKSGLDPREESVTPAPIMARRVVPKYEPPTKADSAADALIISLSERGRVDLERMASLVSKTEAEIIEELQAGEKPLIFKDPESGQWETSNAYLSGNVRKKLIAAKAADIPMNVKALEAVQPAPWTADQVTVMLGSAWVPPAVYAEFYEHITGGKAKASYSRATNTFSLGISEQGPQAGNWSSQGAPAQYILSRLLNSQPVLVMTPGTREEGPKVDQEATAIAQLKAREMVDEFGDWVFRDAARRANLTEIFNDRYNTRVTRQHDGSHLTLPGKVPDGIISMRRHQKNAIWRGIAERFMLIDHAVGAGKTFTGIARAIERRRMGLSKKPMIVVPNHLVEQWAADVYRLYPGAKVLAASSKDFDVKRRRRLFAKIATGDWDIVIVPHSSFAFIGVAPETEERFLREELRIAMEAVEEAEQQAIEDGTAGGRGKPFGVKEAERLVEKIQGRLDKLGTKKDRLLTFEQMGVDDLTVDEAHEFKNLFYSSRLTGVRGMGNKTGSQKAFDLYNKVRVLRESPTGSVTFMTGTPISNSAVEMFTMLRYLAADELRDMGMEHFDAWRAQFVEATSKFEPTESGRLKEVTRLGRSWSNMRSLMDLYYGVTDAVTNEDIQKWYREDKGVEFPIPKVKGGERQLVAMKPTEAQLGLLEQVMSAFDILPGIPDPYERNKQRLRLMNVARSVSLDVRSIGRDKLQAAGISTEYGASPEKGGKLERVSEEIKRIYDKWTPDLGTQLVFLDRSVPKSKGDDKIIKAYDALQAKAADALDKGDEEAYSAVLEALEKYDANEIAELRAAQAGGWNAYQQLKDNLVAQGIPASEIRFVQEADDDAKKKALFDAVNGGKVRVLIGSTPRMGAGTNVQQRLVGLHHVDVTWKPSDIEQREGRIIRQPSSDSFSLMEKYGPSHEVEIFAYATERTVDAKMWDLNATKLKMINGIRKYDGSFTMEFEDEDSVSMAEMAALASGDPLLLERVTLESQISTLELQERGFRRNQYSVEDQVRAAEKAIKEGPSTIQTYKERAALTQPAVQELAEAANGRKVTIEGKTFNTQYSANAAATEAIKIAKGDDENKRYSINVNGVGLTNKEAIAEAIADSLGDVEPFQMTVRGATYIRRTPAAKAITELINEARKTRRNGETIELGEVAGLTLAADLKIGDKYDDVTLVLRKDGQTLAQGYGIPEVKTTQFTAGSIRGRIEKLLESLEQTARGTGDWAKERMEQAERDLPGLRERMGQKFPKAEEIEEKRRRLAEVIGTLSGAKAEATDAGASEDGSTAPPPAAFMRGDPNAPGARVTAVQQFMDSITEKWSNAPTVIVAANMADTLVPKAVRDYNEGQKSQGAVGEPMGFFYDGKVYVLAGSLNSPQDALTVLAHEALGHYGLRGMFGDRLDGIKSQIIAMRKKEVLAKVKAYGLDSAKREDLMYAAEEVLAELAQTRPDIGFVKRAIAAIRTWLRQNVPGFNNLRLSDNELIQNYILPARAWVERGGPGGGGGGGLPAMSRADQTDTPAFRKWFGDSKVVDADGKPLVVYHGTPYDFVSGKSPAAFNTKDFGALLGKGAYFTSDPVDAEQYAGKAAYGGKPNILPVYVSLQNPKVVDSVLAKLPSQSEIVAQGFDGVVLQNNDGSVKWAIAFKPEQIKSAIGNNGTFDAENPDIRFSRSLGDTLASATNSVRDVALPAGYKVNDLIGSVPGKLNWWHKTVGTQYNLAQRSPAFKRVFDGVQNFINDVSFYATEAADLAPNILPKLETWKDITKTPLSANDTKAISAPIFEGTLIWARDESGKPVKMTELEGQAAQLTVEQKAQRLMRNQHITEQILKMWQGLPIDQYETIINGKYERDMLKAGIVWTPAELKALFNLTGKQDANGKWDGQIGLYQEFRTATNKSLTNLAVSDMLRYGGDDVSAVRDQALNAKTPEEAANILADHLRELSELIPERETVLMNTANVIIDKGDRAADLMKRGYAPLSRFGQYTLDVVSKEGERVYFGMFENKFDAARMAREMEKQFPGARITRGTVSEQAYKMFAGVSPETLELFGNMLGLEANGDSASAQVFQEYLKLAKSNRSSMKRLIERKGISGFSEDSGRVLAGFVYSNARQTASNLHMGEMTQAAGDNQAFGRNGELQDAAVKLVDYIKNPQEEAQQIRGLLFAQYIGGSVASAMVNLTQPVTMTFPWLSQFGGIRKAATQMAAATKDALKKTTGDKALDAALHRAEEDGTVSPQEVHQLMQQSMGKGALRSGDGTKSGDAMALAQNSLSRISLAWGKLFSVAEQFNRRSTFIAAYRTAVEQGMRDPDAFARRAIAETQGIYNKGNKPAWARGAIGSTLFTFKQFSISYVEMISRMAKSGPEGKKAALLALAVLFLVSGAGGLPGADDLDDLISGALQALGYNFDSKAKRKEFFASIVGEGGAQFLERGLSGLPGVPIDVSGRLGLGNLIPGTGLFTKKTDHTTDVAEIAGPAGDLAKRTFQAAGQMFKGDALGAVESVSPTTIRNVTKAYDMATMGMYRDQSGKKVIDTDTADWVSKGIGFQPNDVKKVQDAGREVQRMIALNKMRETEIADQWAKGLFEKDPAKVQAARDDLARWNTDNPESPIRISFGQILKRVKAMNQTKEQRLVKTAPKEIRNTVREELAAAR